MQFPLPKCDVCTLTYQGDGFVWIENGESYLVCPGCNQVFNRVKRRMEIDHRVFTQAQIDDMQSLLSWHPEKDMLKATLEQLLLDCTPSEVKIDTICPNPINQTVTVWFTSVKPY